MELGNWRRMAVLGRTRRSKGGVERSQGNRGGGRVGPRLRPATSKKRVDVPPQSRWLDSDPGGSAAEAWGLTEETEARQGGSGQI
ncbi:hypothetical protein M6B38_197095 [Iris pallida]|uniref:Uncharacterized protein n=1 Tax=Iris pallida TaxID=29817 RepID=A0AAX6ECG2_IRIPA|nr:hypothetical protein M6B38_197095 [Iris pallida]